MHLTRNKVPKEWPIKRKGTKYIVRASSSKDTSLPMLFVLRDILKIVSNKKEARQILNQGDIKVNEKVIKEEKFPIQIADILYIEKMQKYYTLVIESKKFRLEEIKEKDSGKKAVKVIGKKFLPGKKIQINLRDGRNILFNEKVNVGDSIILNLKNKKIDKVLKLETGCLIEILFGKHAGSQGKLEEIKNRERSKVYLIALKDKTIALPLNLIKVIE